MANSNLGQAKTAKNDEFYTQYPDIQKELNAYLEYDADVFRGKTVLLPCDDPEWSNFTKFFAQNFENFGLKKLISTSFAMESKNYKTDWQPTLFETHNPLFDVDKTAVCGKIFTLDHGRRHQPLQLMTMADNLKFSRHKDIQGKSEYQHYDNYDAIEVPYTDAIPSDYEGIMGVPISFLDKYCPEQFEILSMTDRDCIYKTKEYTQSDSPKYADLNRRGSIKTGKTYISTYARILIRKIAKP